MVIPESYLMHHGVKGQKWGVRRYQNPDGTLTAAGRKRYGSEEVYEKATAYKNAKKTYDKSWDNYYSKSLSAYSLNKKKREANDQRFQKALSDYGKAETAKKDYKNAKTDHRKEAVKKYQTEYNKHNSAQEKHDDAGRKLDEMYKSLGSNRVSRAINVAKGSSKEAKAYSREYDKWVNKQDKLDAEWEEVSKLYRNTGRNRVDRIINNVKYS